MSSIQSIIPKYLSGGGAEAHKEEGRIQDDIFYMPYSWSWSPSFVAW